MQKYSDSSWPLRLMAVDVQVTGKASVSNVCFEGNETTTICTAAAVSHLLVDTHQDEVN